MAVPKYRQSFGRTRRRRSHLALRATHTVLCPNCSEPRRPHRACSACGYVRPGLQVRATLKEE